MRRMILVLLAAVFLFVPAASVLAQGSPPQAGADQTVHN